MSNDLWDERGNLAAPDSAVAGQLLGTPWTEVMVQSGRITRKTHSVANGWSVGSLVIRCGSGATIWVCAEGYECGGVEHFGLRFLRVTDEWLSGFFARAWPRYAPVSQLPPGLEVLVTFEAEGPLSGELGLGADLIVDHRTVAPVVWCSFRYGASRLLLFADEEIPLNVGLSSVVTEFGEESRVAL
jgi:hypothetical protein